MHSVGNVEKLGRDNNLNLWERLVKWWTEPQDEEMNRRISQLHEYFEKKNRK